MFSFSKFDCVVPPEFESGVSSSVGRRVIQLHYGTVVPRPDLNRDVQESVVSSF